MTMSPVTTSGYTQFAAEVMNISLSSRTRSFVVVAKITSNG